MLQRDYFIRIIEEFFKAIAIYTNIKDQQKRDHELKDLYRQYVGPYEVVRNLSFDELLEYAHDQWPEDQFMERLNFVAELLYAEADYVGNAMRPLLLQKTYKIYSYLDANSDVTSMDRRDRMKKIESLSQPQQ